MTIGQGAIQTPIATQNQPRARGGTREERRDNPQRKTRYKRVFVSSASGQGTRPVVARAQRPRALIRSRRVSAPTRLTPPLITPLPNPVRGQGRKKRALRNAKGRSFTPTQR